MYTSFFGLTEKPFAITPDPRYLYLSERHAEALAHLLYGINESGGFIQLTGEVGTGKTTVVRTLLSRLPQHADVAVIMNPRVTPAEFLLTICEELGIAIAPADRDSVKQMVDALNRRLLEAHSEGRRVIVIVDEAQNLSADVLEQVRLLTNLETPTQKLLQIILIGQPELRELLGRNELRQLAQRITGRYHLCPLAADETKAYVRHRLRVAGVTTDIFSAAALHEVHRLSSGIPRVINVCCDRALLGAFTRESRHISAALVRSAAGEVYGRRFAPAWIGWVAGGAAGVAVAVLLFGSLHYWAWHGSGETRATAVDLPASDPTTAGANAVDSPDPVNAAAGPIAPAGPAGAVPAAAAAPSAVVAAAGAPAAAPAAGTAGAAGAAAGPARALGSASAAVSLNGLLEASGAATSEAAAYRRLLSLWGITMPDDKNPCGQARSAGLACFDQRGSWAEVHMLNRPAILTLTDDQGLRHHVVLTALTDKTATLALGDHAEQLPLDEVSRYWFGEFTVVWKPKTKRTRELSVGMSGDEVRWLRRSLNALQGTAADPDQSDQFDTELAKQVENFQREHRLNVDGIAGIRTQMVLETALADPDSPLLQPPPVRGG
jgi:general secretion pathway protein A